MDFFDRLKEPGKLVTGKGRLKKNLGEQINGFEVWDELRRMLLDEESEYWDLYSPVERDEFIFQILFHLCLGGELCQYEDDLEPYLKATKLLYKDVISVSKDPETQHIVPTSLVFKAVAKTKNGQSYFPFDEDNPQNFCYLIIDPVKRVVTVIIHQFGSSF
ncbi:hypothetical protein J437_LFUL009892 [Ladona fulva]|uniref:Cilia- and flagella-associated protein 300 n=1 Tax=Ladona fulva TaxID=123851 RepID=A0A8K0NYJ4_LADFU|nr:hypothetical protein J437_LFUL009892 [Ladona fulva]